ncbi:hypothetical protein ABN702_22330 [Bacillus haimaensis]
MLDYGFNKDDCLGRTYPGVTKRDKSGEGEAKISSGTDLSASFL